MDRLAADEQRVVEAYGRRGFPAHESALFLFLTRMILRNAIGHSGFELLPRRWQRLPITSVTHHDLHHSTTRWNYGLYFTWWDRLMRTEHPHE